MSSTVATQIPTGTWSIDPVHSSIGFGVKHFGVSTFRGSFSGAAGSIVTDDGAIRSVDGTVRIENLVTEEPAAHGAPAQRGLLRRGQSSRDHVQEHVDRAGRRRTGSASTASSTIRGVTRPVELDAEIEGAGDDPYGNTRLGITATGAVDRTDWGITWNAPPLANGALVVGERVAITLHVEAVRQA